MVVMATCKFKGGYTGRCSEEVYEDSLCILHLDFPKENNPKFAHIIDEKQKRTKKKIEDGDFNFEGAKVYNVLAKGVNVPENSRLMFVCARIRGIVDFTWANIADDVLFDQAKITEKLWFYGAKIGGRASLPSAEIGGYLSFRTARIGVSLNCSGTKVETAYFDSMVVEGDADFIGVTANNIQIRSAVIKGDAKFDCAKIGERVLLVGTSVSGNASFNSARIGYALPPNDSPSSFDVASVAGELTFDNACFACSKVKKAACLPAKKHCPTGVRFACLKSEEAAYRAAKKNCNDRGATAKADEYFYNEMVARRKQKHQPTKSLELVVQYGLGYGARPAWLGGWWILIAVLGAISLGLASSNWQWQNLGRAFAAAFVPGYLIIDFQNSGAAEVVAAVLTVLNFFLWAAFIAVFSRKYID